jgi:hypothetical protein
MRSMLWSDQGFLVLNSCYDLLHRSGNLTDMVQNDGWDRIHMGLAECNLTRLYRCVHDMVVARRRLVGNYEPTKRIHHDI